jgi:quercetin dioxygenase-like cupin family protein
MRALRPRSEPPVSLLGHSSANRRQPEDAGTWGFITLSCPPPGQHAPALKVVGMKVTLLASNETTQSYGFTLQQGDEGTGPPPHSHDWDESFCVLKGKVEFLRERKTYMCMPGTLVHAPRRTVHGFRYGAGGGQMLEITGKDALAAQMFTAVDNEIPVPPPDVTKLLEVLKNNGVTVAT